MYREEHKSLKTARTYEGIFYSRDYRQIECNDRQHAVFARSINSIKFYNRKAVKDLIIAIDTV